MHLLMDACYARMDDADDDNKKTSQNIKNTTLVPRLVKVPLKQIIMSLLLAAVNVRTIN